MLLHDVKLLFAKVIDDVERGRAAIAASLGTKLVLLGLEVTRDGLSPRGLRSLLRRALFRRLVRRLRTFVERASGVALDERRRNGRLLDGGPALLALGHREQLGDALVQPRELGEKSADLRCEGRDLLAQCRVLLAQAFELAHGRAEIILGSPCRSPFSLFEHGSPVPAASSGGEVDAGEQGREHRAVDGDLRRVAREGGKLETAGLETFREDTPARAIEPERFRDPSSLVEKEVEMAVDGIEPEAPDGAGEGVERAAHVERGDRDEHAYRRRQAQHARRASITRRNVTTETSSPNSSRAPAISKTYRAVILEPTPPDEPTLRQASELGSLRAEVVCAPFGSSGPNELR